jgi:thiamine-monophosphate kinase
VGAEIEAEAIPRAQVGKKRVALELALHGGDDYELLAAIEPRAFEHVAAGFAKRFGRPLLRIGRFETGEGRAWIGRYGKRGVVTPSGYDHMKRMRGTD